MAQAKHLTRAADQYAAADAAIKAAEKLKDAARAVFLKDGRDVFYTSGGVPITRRDMQRESIDLAEARKVEAIAEALEPFKRLTPYATFSVSKRERV